MLDGLGEDWQPRMPETVRAGINPSLLYLGLVLVGLFLVTVVGFLVTSTVQKFHADRKWVLHTYEAQGHLEQLELALVDANRCKRGFVITGDDSALVDYYPALDSIQRHLSNLEVLTRDNHDQQRALAELRTLLDEYTARMNAQVLTRRERGFDLSTEVNLAREMEVLLSTCRATLKEIRQREDVLLSARTGQVDRQSKQMLTYILLMLVVAILFLLVAAAHAYIELRHRIRVSEAMLKSSRELERSNRELERSNRELDDFAYIASHDLKEPLRGIRNYAGFLLEDYQDRLDGDGQAKLATLTKLADRLENFIEDLLRYSRVGRESMAMKLCDIAALANDIIDQLHPWLEQEGVQVDVAADLPHVICHPVYTAEIFRNLIGNGVKYNNKSEKRIWVGCKESSNGNVPVFYVRDNGIGIPEKHRENVFQIFKRLHGRDKFGGGSGAGLTITRKIVERHGGRIWLDSVEGEGTTFNFTLAEGNPNQ